MAGTLSLAVLLAQRNTGNVVDIIPDKVERINRRVSSIQDAYIEKYLDEKELDLTATLDGENVYREADFIVIVALTNYDLTENFFDCSFEEALIRVTTGWNEKM